MEQYLFQSSLSIFFPDVKTMRIHRNESAMELTIELKTDNP